MKKLLKSFKKLNEKFVMESFLEGIHALMSQCGSRKKPSAISYASNKFLQLETSLVLFDCKSTCIQASVYIEKLVKKLFREMRSDSVWL